MTITWLDALLTALCAYRLTQLVVWDEISEPVVTWLGDRSPWLKRLLACAHCSGFWCSLFAVAWLYAIKTIGWWPLQAFMLAWAVAAVISIIEHATGWLNGSGH